MDCPSIRGVCEILDSGSWFCCDFDSYCDSSCHSDFDFDCNCTGTLGMRTRTTDTDRHERTNERLPWCGVVWYRGRKHLILFALSSLPFFLSFPFRRRFFFSFPSEEVINPMGAVFLEFFLF